MNRGDTKYLRFVIKQNGEPIDLSVFDDIEIQINEESGFRSVKKLMSKGDILIIDGYLQAFLTQEETFMLNDGIRTLQVRLLSNNQVVSTDIVGIRVGKVLSGKVL